MNFNTKFNANFIFAEHLYNKGLYNDDDIAWLVRCRLLTVEEYEKITGKEYVPNRSE